MVYRRTRRTRSPGSAAGCSVPAAAGRRTSERWPARCDAGPGRSARPRARDGLVDASRATASSATSAGSPNPTPDWQRELGLPGWRRTDVVQYVPERSLTVRALDGARPDPGLRKGVRTGVNAAVRGWPAATTRSRVQLRAAPAPVTSPDSLAWSDARRVLIVGGDARAAVDRARPATGWPDALAGLGVAVAVLHDSAPGRRTCRRSAGSAPTGSRAAPTWSAWPGPTWLGEPTGSPPASPRRSPHPAAGRRPARRLPPRQRARRRRHRGPDRPRPDGHRRAAAADLGSLLARLRYAAAVG